MYCITGCSTRTCNQAGNQRPPSAQNSTRREGRPRRNMPAVVWSSGVFPLALWLASVCIFVASPMANAFLTAAPVSSRLARGAAAAVDTNRAKGVAFDGERSRQATVLFAIKKKVDYNKKESFGGVIDPGTGGVMGALGKDPDAFMAMIEKNRARSAEAAVAAAEEGASDQQGTADGDEHPGKESVEGDGGGDENSEKNGRAEE